MTGVLIRACLLILIVGLPVRAQDAFLTVYATASGQPLEGAIVSAAGRAARTDLRGRATLALAAGIHDVRVTRLGFAPESLRVVLIADRETIERIAMQAEAHVDPVIVSATRFERRIEQEPTRVEVIDREEVEEKLLMTPGDIAMLLNETSGLRVQTTAPSLGGTALRIQGLPARYALILSDGLPLHGDAAGIGMLQIPPMDLARVEVIKGAASALYGGSAAGGVVNLVSRRPAVAWEREVLVNRTTRAGADGLLWSSGPITDGLGYTLLGGAHAQDLHDVDGDGWGDLPRYRRGVLRPRLFWERDGASVLFTAGYTGETRRGGTLPGRTAPDGEPFIEGLDTRRADAGLIGSWPLAVGRVGIRASTMAQHHDHRFGSTHDPDVHRTGFAEATLTQERGGGSATFVHGAAFQYDSYRAPNAPSLAYEYAAPGVFTQAEFVPAGWVALSAGGRLDFHSHLGTLESMRLAALFRPAHGWSTRIAIGSGRFVRTGVPDDAELIGASRVTRRSPDVEHVTSGSLDVGRTLGPLELNTTLFAASAIIPGLVTVGPESVRGGCYPACATGVELLARFAAEDVHVIGTWAMVNAYEDGIRASTLPSHTAGLVAAYEMHGEGRIGLEVYRTGPQMLAGNPYQPTAPAHVIIGALLDRRFGPARVFLNLENLGDVRVTRHHPLVRPTPTVRGKWTTEAWTELAGRTINGGVWLTF